MLLVAIDAVRAMTLALRAAVIVPLARERPRVWEPPRVSLGNVRSNSRKRFGSRQGKYIFHFETSFCGIRHGLDSV